MIVRVLHMLAIAGLIGSAAYAYSIKYETLYHAEQVAKLKAKVQRERDGIAVLRAEWQHLNRPDRLQAAVERQLEALLLAGATATPKDKRTPDPRTTGTTTPRR
jgi:hypothetical protein